MPNMVPIVWPVDPDTPRTVDLEINVLLNRNAAQ